MVERSNAAWATISAACHTTAPPTTAGLSITPNATPISTPSSPITIAPGCVASATRRPLSCSLNLRDTTRRSGAQAPRAQTNGLLVAAVVDEADLQDRDGASLVLGTTRDLYPWQRHVFADRGYRGAKLAGALDKLGRWTVEIVTRSDTATGFVVLRGVGWSRALLLGLTTSDASPRTLKRP